MRASARTPSVRLLRVPRSSWKFVRDGHLHDRRNAINFADPAPTEPNANEIAAMPYRYRVR